jgi:membrane protease YdiL (CAAX protease family)
LTFTPLPSDYAILFALFAAMTYELAFPRLKRRTIAYAGNVVILWLLAGAVIASWFVTKRSWALLFLGPVVWWRIAIGLLLFIAFFYVGLRNRRVALKHPKALQHIERAVSHMEWMMPITAVHMRWWAVVSLTAGITEEVLIRGFLVAFVAHFIGLPAGIIIAALLFGIGHAYQQPRNVLPTGLYGLGLNIVVLISGSLLPAMAIHVAQDYFAGELAHLALMARHERAETSTERSESS